MKMSRPVQYHRAMSGKTIKRDHLYRAVYQKVRLSRAECVTLVELVLKQITWGKRSSCRGSALLSCARRGDAGAV